MRWHVVSVLMLVHTVAHAETADEAVALGQTLARDGKHAAAIAAFREAERIEPRALHDCLIGLAYLRAGALTDADIAFAECRRRDKDGLPPWVANEEAVLAQQIATSELIHVRVRADAALATMTIGGVLDGLPFAPRTSLRLRPGTYQVTARALDGRTLQRELVVRYGEASVLELVLPGTADVERPESTSRDDRSSGDHDAPERRSRGPLLLTIAGGALVTAGVAMNLTWVRSARSAAADATERPIYDRELDRYKTARLVTVASYAVGGVALITGILWRARERSSPTTPQITGYLHGDGGGLVVQWAH